MTREEILKEYTVENGVIKSPGKFEEERVYVPFFWDIYMNGWHDGETEEGALQFILADGDIEEFPELAEDGYAADDGLYLYQRSDGFVIQLREVEK